MKRLVFGITGASGAPYAARALEFLRDGAPREVPGALTHQRFGVARIGQPAALGEIVEQRLQIGGGGRSRWLFRTECSVEVDVCARIHIRCRTDIPAQLALKLLPRKLAPPKQAQRPAPQR